MNVFIDQFFNIDIMMQSLPYLLKGLMMTIGLTILLAPLGFVSGLLLALAYGSSNRFVRYATWAWVNVFRAMPPLVLIIVVYSALPFLGINLPTLACVVVGLVLNNSAYFCEIIRAGLGAVPKGQMEAARSTGFGHFSALRLVVLPQAIRKVLPDIASNIIEIVKGTSLASVLAIGEMLYAAGVIRSVTYNASAITLASIIYLVLLLPAVRLVGRMERRSATAL